MTVFRYPQNNFDDPERLLSLLGSFWATAYQGNALLRDLAGTAGLLAQQSHLHLLELVRSVSRYTVPIFHQDNWHGLHILESELNTDSGLLEKYSTPASVSYIATTDQHYNEISPQPFYSVTKPEGLENVQVIFNRLTSPSVELIKDIDFQLKTSVITLRNNPFDNPLIPKRDVLDSRGAIVDRECVLWLYRGQWDWQTVYEQFGYALQLQLKSSEGYRNFVNAIFDAFVEGTSVRTQQQALAAVFGIPLVVEATETVKHVVSDTNHLNVITDAHVYQFPTTATTVVTVGDTLQAGDPLTDLMQVFEFNRGAPVTAEDIPALTTGSGLLAWGYWGDLTWDNKEVDIQVELDVDGYTKISWELGGFPFDVEKFWEDIHAKGVAAGETLAMLLDIRENPTGQPTAASLPVTVNPLQFLIDNLLRGNAYVVKIRPGSQLRNQLAFVPVAQLRKIQPPHTLMLLVVELAYADLPVTMDTVGSPLTPGYEEAISGFPCLETSEAINPAALMVERVRLKTIGGRCI